MSKCKILWYVKKLYFKLEKITIQILWAHFNQFISQGSCPCVWYPQKTEEDLLSIPNMAKWLWNIIIKCNFFHKQIHHCNFASKYLSIEAIFICIFRFIKIELGMCLQTTGLVIFSLVTRSSDKRIQGKLSLTTVVDACAKTLYIKSRDVAWRRTYCYLSVDNVIPSHIIFEVNRNAKYGCWRTPLPIREINNPNISITFWSIHFLWTWSLGLIRLGKSDRKLFSIPNMAKWLN